MGLIKWGILGGFSRKVGTVVGASWRGLDTIRGLPRQGDHPKSQLQLDVILKLGMISHLLSYISDLIEIGYGYTLRGSTPMNKAVADNYKSAIVGASPNFTIDPSMLIYSKGKVYIPLDVGLVASLGAVIVFTWDFPKESKYEKPGDQLTILVYNPVKMMFVGLQKAAMRAELQFSLQLPMAFIGDEVYCYLSFNTDEEKPKSSDSRYVGQVQVM